MAVLDALRPWSRSVCPRTREENSKAMLSLCIAAATAAAAGAAAAGGGAEVGAAERDTLVEGVVGTLPAEREGQDSGAININGNASESYALEAILRLPRHLAVVTIVSKTPGIDSLRHVVKRILPDTSDGDPPPIPRSKV